MRILVTGGAGYIGSHAARSFLERGHDVWAFDDLSRGHAQAAPAGRLIVGTLADASAVDAALAGHGIEAGVHFAALTYVGESAQDPLRYYENNVAGTLGLLASVVRHGVRRVVFSSTAATYGVPTRVPIREEDPTAPINPYGRTKLAIEWALVSRRVSSARN